MKIDKYYNEAIVNESNNIIDLINLGKENEVMHAWINYNGNKEIFISELFIPKPIRGKGNAQRIIKTIIAEGKRLKVDKISLNPSDCFGSDLDRLISFYGSFGFKFRQEDKGLMCLYI